MGIRGEVFSTRVLLANRTYFFNVKENRMGDLYLNIVESKNRDEGGFDRQSVILFADDVQEFLKGFDEAMRVMEKAQREKRNSPPPAANFSKSTPQDKSEDAPKEFRDRKFSHNNTESGNEGRRESRNEGRGEGRREGRSDSRNNGRSDNRREGRSESRNNGRSDSRREGRSESRNYNRGEGRVEGRSDSRNYNRSEGRVGGREDKRKNFRKPDFSSGNQRAHSSNPMYKDKRKNSNDNSGYKNDRPEGRSKSRPEGKRVVVKKRFKS